MRRCPECRSFGIIDCPVCRGTGRDPRNEDIDCMRVHLLFCSAKALCKPRLFNWSALPGIWFWRAARSISSRAAV